MQQIDKIQYNIPNPYLNPEATVEENTQRAILTALFAINDNIIKIGTWLEVLVAQEKENESITK